MAYRIILRRDSSTNWNTTDPVLLQGEPGYEIDTFKFKIGDGITNWSGLPYYVGASGSSGTSGIDGSGGSSGTSGIDGSSGTSGSSGSSGSTGSRGTSGTSGSRGSSGTSGSSGSRGTSGSTGTSGTSFSSPYTGNLNVSLGQIWSSSYGATAGIDWNNGNVQTYTLTSNTTFTFSNPKDGAMYTLLLSQDAIGGYSATWPSISWGPYTPPTMSTNPNVTDIYIYRYVNGIYYGLSYVQGY